MIIGDKYYIDDIEIGLYEVSKEQYEIYLKQEENIKIWIEKARSHFKIPVIQGRVFIMGTGGEIDSNEDYRNMFYESENFKTINTIWEED